MSKKVPRFRDIFKEPISIENTSPKELQLTSSLHKSYTRLSKRRSPDLHTSRVPRIAEGIVIRETVVRKNKPPHQTRRQIIHYKYSFSVERESMGFLLVFVDRTTRDVPPWVSVYSTPEVSLTLPPTSSEYMNRPFFH